MIQRTRGRRPVHEVTEPQRRTMKEICIFTNRRGFPPTMKERTSWDDRTPAFTAK
jgi:repressor LexA